jgi:hypothetical protein
LTAENLMAALGLLYESLKAAGDFLDNGREVGEARVAGPLLRDGEGLGIAARE